MSDEEETEMRPRSFLFVPGDSPHKMEKARGTEADALILDLEDGVVPERLPEARKHVAAFLGQHSDRSKQQLWVRIGPLDSDQALPDLAAVVRAKPDGIVLPKVRSAADLERVDHHLSALEAREHLPLGSIGVLPIATETPIALFHLDSYVGCSERLYGLTWGAEDLSTAVGASGKWQSDGAYDDLYRLARSLCLAAARAAQVEPVDCVYTDFRDLEGLAREARDARRQGFTAKIAIHPAQVPVIHEALRPSEEEVAKARAIVEGFESRPGQGTIGLDGKMLDRPHLEQARRVLELAARG